MLVQLSNRMVDVKITHLSSEESLEFVQKYDTLKEPDRVNRVTLCLISTDDDIPLSIGRSVCVKPDTFVRKTGSRRSVLDAMKALNLSREDRTAIHTVVFGGDKHVIKKVDAQPMSCNCASDACTTPAA